MLTAIAALLWAVPWGFGGHEMGARAATDALPAGMPTFFIESGDALVWLNPEPDRWRDRSRPEMDHAWQYDHYVDLENLPEGALDERNRYAFIRLLQEAGLERPERQGGFLYYRILEMHQRLVSGWRAWSTATDPDVRSVIELRIVNDAGILGHYVMDASQPHHTTIHFNGWDADTPNPEEFTDDRTFHSRFERFFVEAHVELADIRPYVTSTRRSVQGNDALRAATREHIMESHAEVETLYRLDRDHGFDPEGSGEPELVDFTARRIASGASMLADLWWSAWAEGTGPGQRK